MCFHITAASPICNGVSGPLSIELARRLVTSFRDDTDYTTICYGLQGDNTMYDLSVVV